MCKHLLFFLNRSVTSRCLNEHTNTFNDETICICSLLCNLLVKDIQVLSDSIQIHNFLTDTHKSYAVIVSIK